MPCLLKIKIIRARSLPVMDRQSSKADAYVEIRFANQNPMRTTIARKTLDPVWNESFRLEINDDAYLQNEPLEFRLLDYDSITANDLIGSVYIDLNSLLTDEFVMDQHYDTHSISKSSQSSMYGAQDELGDAESDEGQRRPLRAGADAGTSAGAGAKDTGDSDGPIGAAINGTKRESNGDTPVPAPAPAASQASGSDASSESSGDEGFIGETTGVPNTYTRTLGGWFPIYDTMWGMRGELKCQVILQYFGDVNPFNNSSAGIQVFSAPSPSLPASIPIRSVGFISSIVTHIDPEYHWADSFRTPRASNEARVRVLHKITGLLRRRMGRKALELSANAIVGYRQWFEYEEEEKLITGRAVGTAVLVGSQAIASSRRASSINECSAFPPSDMAPASAREGMARVPTIEITGDGLPHIQNRRPSTASHISETSHATSAAHEERVSDSSSMVTQSTSSSLSTSSLQSADNVRNQKNADACEIQTFKAFAPGAIHRLGGLVSATSVKLIENDQGRTRELWFDDLRAEIKHHALAIGCSHIIGYTEQMSIRGEIIILVAYGTAAVLELDYEKHGALARVADSTHYALASPRIRSGGDGELRPVQPPQQLVLESPLMRPIDAPTAPHEPQHQHQHQHRRQRQRQRQRQEQEHGQQQPAYGRDDGDAHRKPLGCRMCHASHDRQKLPYPMRFFRCGFCQKKAVPEILLSTIDIPLELDIIDGESCMIEAHICRPVSKGTGTASAPAGPKSRPDGTADEGDEGNGRWRWLGLAKGPSTGADSKLSGEAYAAHISDALPFVHYDLHRQLLYKLSVHGMNAIFGLKYQFSIGEDMIIAVATGTAVYVTGLPTPGPLHIKRNIDVLDEEDRAFIRIQDRIMRQSNANRRRLDRAFRKKRRAMIRLREQLSSHRSRPRDTSLASRRRNGRPGTTTATTAATTAATATHSGPGPTQSTAATGQDDVEGATSDAESSDSSSDSSVSRGDRAEARRRRNIRARVAVQIDDDADEDLMAALLDIPLPPSFLLCNVERPPLFRRFFETSSTEPHDDHESSAWPMYAPLELSSSSSSSSDDSADGLQSDSPVDSDSGSDGDGIRRVALRQLSPDQIQTLVIVKRTTVDPYGKHPNRQLAQVFNGTYLELYTTLTYFARCAIAGIDYRVQVVDEAPRDVQVVLTATVVGELQTLLPRYMINTHLATASLNAASLRGQVEDEVARGLWAPSVWESQAAIELTTMSYLPQRRISAHVGRIALHFVQEVHIDSMSKGPVGMGAFVYSFIAEAQAMARAHTAARGGMAMIALSVDQVQIFRDDRSQAYASISISGDVVRYTS
ncbi:hypothetical protein GGI07_002428 [Coemansia sp. Benny D115]|nr:hypothetical protein GGI07_002428 [Coemansia sp. Benny D115]